MVAGYLAGKGGNILEAQPYNDRADGHFSCARRSVRGGSVIEDLKMGFEPIANASAMTWQPRSLSARRKVMLLVSKFDHCLGDYFTATKVEN